MDKDITNLVEIDNNDNEFVPLLKCVCGQQYKAWDFTISIYRDDPAECAICHRKLYCRIGVKVYEVVE